MPCGEIYTGPVEDSANGWIRFTYPSIVMGITGIELVFKDGEVIEHKAQVGADVLKYQLEMDDGMKRLGEFGIGTNYGIREPTGHPLLDEKIGGTIHLALGQGIRETGNTNEGAGHWDLITDFSDDSQMEFDGEVVYKDGNFVF